MWCHQAWETKLGFQASLAVTAVMELHLSTVSSSFFVYKMLFVHCRVVNIIFVLDYVGFFNFYSHIYIDDLASCISIHRIFVCFTILYSFIYNSAKFYISGVAQTIAPDDIARQGMPKAFVTKSEELMCFVFIWKIMMGFIFYIFFTWRLKVRQHSQYHQPRSAKLNVHNESFSWNNLADFRLSL